MKEKLLILITSLIFLTSFSQAPSVEWQKSFGGTQEDIAKCVLQTPDGGFIVAGSTASNDGDCTDNHGGWDFLVVKTDNTGAVVWKKCYGGSNNDKANTIIKTNDGGYLIGGETNSIDGDITGNTLPNFGLGYNWIVKINQTGTIQWQKFMPVNGETSSSVKTIIETSSSSFIITGDTYFPNGGNGYGDIYIATVGNDGSYNPIANIIIGGGFNDFVNDMKATNDGGYIIVGNTNSSDGFFSDTNNFDSSYEDIWVVKLTSNFTVEWLKLFGGGNSEQAFSVEQTNDGSFIVFGKTDSSDGDITQNQGNSDYWLLKLDVQGVLVWQKTYGGTGNDGGYNIKKTNDGGFILAGRSVSTDGDITLNNGGWDYWIMKIDSLGNIIWQKCYGGTGTDYAFSMDLTSDGGIIFAGQSWPNVLGENGNQGFFDFSLIKLSSSQLSTIIFDSNILSVYPNPVTTTLNIKSDQIALDKIIVTDCTGKIILEQTENLNSLNTENFAKGIYFLKGLSQDKALLIKFIKQ